MVSFLEESVIEAVKDSGGIVKLEHRFIIASFDEAALGFWLDILTTLETILRALKKTSPELYGHIGILGRDIPEEGPRLSKILPWGSTDTGIWCAESVQQALEPYVIFEKPLRKQGKNHPGAGYAQIKTLRAFSALPSGKKYPFSEKIQRTLKQQRQNTLLLGPDFIGKREGIYRFCLNVWGNFPILVIRFGSGGRGLSCFSDALTPQIRSLINLYGGTKILEDLDALGVLIFRERLRNE
jgi:hypothetical protein